MTRIIQELYVAVGSVCLFFLNGNIEALTPFPYSFIQLAAQCPACKGEESFGQLLHEPVGGRTEQCGFGVESVDG